VNSQIVAAIGSFLTANSHQTHFLKQKIQAHDGDIDRVINVLFPQRLASMLDKPQ